MKKSQVCDHCGGHFGLVTYRWWSSRFCKAPELLDDVCRQARALRCPQACQTLWRLAQVWLESPDPETSKRERDGPHREGEEPKPMMHGREKSDLAIVAVKPANKAKEAHCGGICGGGRSGVGGAKGGGQGEYAPAKHVLGSEPGSRDKRAGAYTATFAVTYPRWEPHAGKPHVRIWAGGVR